jgi:hypothetical protein
MNFPGPRAPTLNAARPGYAREPAPTKIETTALTQPGPNLTRSEDNRGHKFVVAVIARPGMADASRDAELRFLGNKQHAAATRASGPAKITGRNVLDAGTMDAHRRSSSTLLSAPQSGLIQADVARGLWRPCDAFMKLSWPHGTARQFDSKCGSGELAACGRRSGLA